MSIISSHVPHFVIWNARATDRLWVNENQIIHVSKIFAYYRPVTVRLSAQSGIEVARRRGCIKTRAPKDSPCIAFLSLVLPVSHMVSKETFGWGFCWPTRGCTPERQRERLSGTARSISTPSKRRFQTWSTDPIVGNFTSTTSSEPSRATSPLRPRPFQGSARTPSGGWRTISARAPTALPSGVASCIWSETGETSCAAITTSAGALETWSRQTCRSRSSWRPTFTRGLGGPITWGRTLTWEGTPLTIFWRSSTKIFIQNRSRPWPR